MRKFILNISKAVFLLLIYFVIVGLINILFIKTNHQDIEKFNILILGDSHLERSIDPSYFKNSKNVSLSAEPYFISFWKLKKMIEISDFDTAIIGYSFHNLSEFNDIKVFDKFWATEFYNRYYTIEEYETVPGLKFEISEYYYSLWKNLCFFPKPLHNTYIGNYKNWNRVDEDHVQEAINRHYYVNEEKLGVSTLSKLYLDSIINYCQDHNIYPILLSTPLKDSYFSKIPITIQKEYHLFKTKYENEGVLIIDKSRDSYPDSLFLNADHINVDGSRRFENELSQLLRKTQ